MLEHHVNALLAGEPAHHALEPVSAVVDHVIGAKCACLGRLVVAADGGDHGAAKSFRDAYGDAADTGAAGVHQDGLAGFQFCVVEQHVLDGGVGDRHAGGIAQIDRVRHLDHEACGMVGQFLREPIDMEAAHAGDVLAQVLAAAPAGAAGAADQRGVRHDPIARRKRRDAVADCDDIARRLGTDGQRESPLGEGHPAEAPYVDVVQPDGGARSAAPRRRWAAPADRAPPMRYPGRRATAAHALNLL